jgi:hypothetical protein
MFYHHHELICCDKMDPDIINSSVNYVVQCTLQQVYLVCITFGELVPAVYRRLVCHYTYTYSAGFISAITDSDRDHTPDHLNPDHCRHNNYHRQ